MRKIILNIAYMTKTTFKFSKLQYFLAAFSLLWNSITPFINLYFPKLILDELTMEKRWDYILFLIGVWALFNGLIAIFNVVVDVLANPYRDRCTFKENLHYLNMDADMDYEKLENGATLDEQGRIGSNLSLSNFSNSPLFELLTNVIQLIGYTYIIATLHPLMIVFLLMIILLNSFISKRLHHIEFDYQKKIAKFKRRFNYLFSVLIGYSYAKEIRINHAAEWVSQKYEIETSEYINTYAKNQHKNFIMNLFSESILFVQTMVLYVYSAYRATIGAISIGDFSLYIGAVTLFISSFTSLMNKTHKLKYVSEYIDSYKLFVGQSRPKYLDKGVLDIDIDDERHEIEFKNVSYKYPSSESYVLKNISLKIKDGERIAFVGYNGAGKTTLIKLICRLYEPTEGTILYNGIDISTLKYEQYVERLSVVFQDFNIYSMSVTENICVAGNVNNSKIMNAIKLSGLSEKIIKLPMGLDTQIDKEFDENGIEFSGGEQQKLACARAYYKNAPIVILDEPTASLDPISENQLYERFNNIIENKSAIYVSHRLAGVRFCDRIIVFSNGEIVERGTHVELIKQKGLYSEMFSKQAEYYIENGS